MGGGISKGSTTYKSVVGAQMIAERSKNGEEQFIPVVTEEKLLTLEEFLDQMVTNLDDGIITEENVNDAIGEHGETRLHVAAANGRKDIYSRLIELEAGLDVKDNDGETPLHWAARSGEYEACSYLIESFKKVSTEEQLKDYLNMENTSGENALFAPAENGNLKVCLLLLAQGINASAANENELTAYGVADANKVSDDNLEGLSEEILAQLEDLIADFLPQQEFETEEIDVVVENNLDALESDDDWLNDSQKTTPRATAS